MAAKLRTVAAVVTIVVGVALVVEPVAMSLFRDAPGGERVTDRFRSTLSQPGLVALQRNFKTVGGMGNEFLTRTLPDLRSQLHITPGQFDASLRGVAPAALTARRDLPPAVALVAPVVPQLVGVHDAFDAVDSLPFLGLPITTIPWILTGAGVLLIGVGVVVLRWRDPRATWLVAAAGLGLVVVPLALS